MTSRYAIDPWCTAVWVSKAPSSPVTIIAAAPKELCREKPTLKLRNSAAIICCEPCAKGCDEQETELKNAARHKRRRKAMRKLKGAIFSEINRHGG